MAGSARISKQLHRTLSSACVAVLLGLAAASSAAAQDAYWQGRIDTIWEHGIDTVFDESNWYTKPVEGRVRPPPAGTAFFAQGAFETDIRITAGTEVAALIVEPNNHEYSFTVEERGDLGILGAGIFNKASTPLRITISGTLEMHNAAQFSASGSLKSAVIKVRETGDLFMTGISRGGNAEVKNNGGLVSFSGFASADRMEITNAYAFPFDRGGSVLFHGHSTGGDARFVNLGYGRLDFSQTRGPLGNNIVTAGAIYSDGSISVGLNTLVVARNFKIGRGPGFHEVFIDVIGNRTGSVQVKGNVDLGHESYLHVIWDTAKRKPGRYLLLSHEGARTGSINLVDNGLHGRLERLPNEIWLVVP